MDLREGIATLPLLLAAQETSSSREALAGGSLEGALAPSRGERSDRRARLGRSQLREKALACLDGTKAGDELEAIAKPW